MGIASSNTVALRFLSSWFGTTPHYPKKVKATAPATNIRLTLLSSRASELMASEHLWRLAKAVVAAYQVYEAVQQHTQRFAAWLDALAPCDQVLKSGLFTIALQWQST